MSLYTITITLFLVLDPLGNVPIFLSMLKKVDPKRHVSIIFRESCIAFVILAVFVFFGQYILVGLHIGTPALSIAGGIILFFIAIRLIFPSEKTATKEEFEEPFIVPMAIPMIAGPSAMATILLYVSREPQSRLMVLLGLFIASAVSTLIVVGSHLFMRLLGQRGLAAVERLMGMILTTVAVQMLLSGILDYVHHPMM